MLFSSSEPSTSELAIAFCNGLSVFFRSNSLGVTTDLAYDEQAWIGLLLLIKKAYESEYHFFSPSNRLFGNKIYVICNRALQWLDINLSTMTPTQESKYYDSFRLSAEKFDYCPPEYLEKLLKNLPMDQNNHNPLATKSSFK